MTFIYSAQLSRNFSLLVLWTNDFCHTCIFDLSKRLHGNGDDHSGNTLTEPCGDHLWCPAEDPPVYILFRIIFLPGLGKLPFDPLNPNGPQVTITFVEKRIDFFSQMLQWKTSPPHTDVQPVWNNKHDFSIKLFLCFFSFQVMCIIFELHTVLYHFNYSCAATLGTLLNMTHFSAISIGLSPEYVLLP